MKAEGTDFTLNGPVGAAAEGMRRAHRTSGVPTPKEDAEQVRKVPAVEKPPCLCPFNAGKIFLSVLFMRRLLTCCWLHPSHALEVQTTGPLTSRLT